MYTFSRGKEGTLSAGKFRFPFASAYGIIIVRRNAGAIDPLYFERGMSMEKSISECIQLYREQLENGDIRRAYITLTKYAAELKMRFPKEYKTSNLAPGYLDYTYFYFSNSFLDAHKLKFALVLNHRKTRFELWLTGRTADVREKYRALMKDTKWGQGADTKPKYSILEICLKNEIDFENKERMTADILTCVTQLSKEILSFLGTA